MDSKRVTPRAKRVVPFQLALRVNYVITLEKFLAFGKMNTRAQLSNNSPNSPDPFQKEFNSFMKAFRFIFTFVASVSLE